MSVIDCVEKIRGPQSSGQTDERFQNPRGETTREFTLTSNNVNDSPLLIRRQAQSLGWLPRNGNPHPDDFFSRCTGVTCNKIGPIYYEAVATYITLVADGENENNDPTLEPVSIRWGFISTTEQIDEDVDGNPIRTITGESFDPPLTEEFFDLTCTISSNVAYFDPLIAADYMGAVNTDTVFGVFPPGTARILDLSAESITAADYSYWRRNAQLVFRAGTDTVPPSKAWWRRVLAEGFYVNMVVQGFDPVRFRAVDDAGEFASKPVLHDIQTGEEITDPAQAQWYMWKTKKTRPFAPLNLV